jgi:hypothetical protein
MNSVNDQARDCTAAIGLSVSQRQRAMSLLAEVGLLANEPVFHANRSRTEVGVRPYAGAECEAYISRSRIMARPGVDAGRNCAVVPGEKCAV